MSKLSDKDLKVIYALLAVVVLALTYFFGVSKNMQKRSDILAENIELQAQLDELVSKELQKDQIVKETEDMNKIVEEKCNYFPSKTTSQMAYYTVNDIMEKTELEVASIAVSMNDIFFVGSGDVGAYKAALAEAEAAAQEAGATGETEAAADATTEEATEENKTIQLDELVGYKSTVTLAYEGTAEALKKAVDYICASNEKGERMTLGNISVAFDSGTGNLSGSMIIYMYALEGNGKAYTEPAITGIEHGVTDVFGSFDTKKKK